MTDNHTDRPDDGLDAAIRTLVGRAVADAPPAPVIDERSIAQGPIVRPIGSAPSARNRWIAGGLAALTTAAAVIAIAVVARPDTAEAPAPATVPPVTVPTGATTVPQPVPTTVPTTSPAVVEGTEPPATTAAETVPPSPPPTPAPPPDLPEVIVVAGDDGIWIDTGDAFTEAFAGDPVTTALRVADGRIFFQYRSDEQTNVFVTPAPDGDPPAIVPMPADFPGTAVLHDAAVVDGEVVLLVESSPVECTNPNTCIGSVWAIWPDRGTDGEGVVIDEQNVWEAGWSRLSLSSTGVVVGMKSAEVSSSPWSVTIPGVSAEPLDPASVGLEADYVDCATCPIALTIDVTGRYVGWVERSVDGTVSIVVKRIDDGWTLAYDIADASLVPLFPTLDIGSVVVDGTAFVQGGAILNDPEPTADTAAVVFDLTNSANEPVGIGVPASRMAFGV